MSINVIQLVQGALTESVLQQLATKLGVAPEAAKRVVGLVAPALVGSLMSKAASPEGARGLFASIMSADSNSNIVEALPQLIHGDGLQSLLAAGTRLAGAVASDDRISALTHTVASQTGVSTGSTSALTGIVTTMLFGVLKHYFTKNTGSVGALPTLLGHQLPTVKASLNDGGAPTIQATVGSEEEKAKLLEALTTKFGANHFNATITVDPATKPASWLDKLDGLLPLMQLPGAEAKLSGDNIELSGAAADARNGWMDKLKSLFGAGFTIGTFDVKGAVENAKESFMSAFSSLSDDCSATDVTKVLNLQVINFRTGSDVPPQDAQLALAKSAQLLKTCAGKDKTVKLNVGGYSDNVGVAASNLALSKKRAEAVRAFLVKHGVRADSLTAQGFGDAHPIADNATASGRFANRRIDFAVQEQ
jgi:outer membrane protein OmpA-like peptidoglycan-associated protein